MASSTPTRGASNAFRVNRRHERRTAACVHVTALRQNLTGKPDQYPVCSLRMHDLSPSGMGATCDTRLDADEPVTICIPPHGPEGGFDLVGHVVRCQASGDGAFRVGIAFDADQFPAKAA